MSNRRLAFVVMAILLFVGCASVLKHKDAELIKRNEEYEKVIHVKNIPQVNDAGAYVMLPGPEPIVAKPSPSAATPVQTVKKPPRKGKESAKASSNRRQPEIEDDEGFGLNRRPQVDPFRLGEKVTLEATYFGMAAGDISLEVRPFVEVNGRKSYSFIMTAKTISVFAMVYTVDDWAETYVDYETMTPFNYSLHVQESKQLREVRSVFNWNKNQAFVWDKKVTKKNGTEEKRYEWNVPHYSQNVFSAPFYLRTFQLKPGKKIVFNIGHEGKNLLMTIDVLRREKLSTAIGELDTVVVKPTIEIDGVFKPVGDIYLWLTDDDRKFIVRVESKIRIGTVVGRVKSIERGQD